MWNDDGRHGYSGMHDAMNGGDWLSMLLVLLVLLVLLSVAAVAVVALLRTRRGPAHDKDPRHLLAERYARGEIDDAEYAHGLSVLGRS